MGGRPYATGQEGAGAPAGMYTSEHHAMPAGYYAPGAMGGQWGMQAPPGQAGAPAPAYGRR